MKKKDKKIRIDRLFLFLAILLLIIFLLIKGFSFIVKTASSLVSTNSTGYLSSIDNKIQLYDMEFKEAIEVVRGTEVTYNSKKVAQKDENNNVVDEYTKITYDKKDYLIKEENIVLKLEESVQEKTLYVRTPATVYEDEKESTIKGHATKGKALEIIGFDKIDKEGNVNKYKIKTDKLEGFVYSKYLVKTEEEAKKHYDYKGNLQIHQNRGNRFGGGNAGTLDYYPYQKASFEDNVMPKEVRSLYLNAGVVGNVDAYIKIAKDSNINAFVVDIKDNTSPGYPANAMKKYSPTNYARAINTYEGYRKAIKKLKDAGFYVIGRITIFKDSYYVSDHPESAITSTSTNKPYKHNGSYWPSVFARDVWEFNVALAIESVKEMGFHEIQFDYVRFPDRTGSIESQGLVNMKNNYNESKAQAIQAFLMYACDEIHAVNAYVSADVFGESANNYVAAYGQYWAAISNIVDVISGMPYPDHFSKGEYGLAIPWEQPYTLLNSWGKTVMSRQKEIETPAIVRTWIQAYNAIYSPNIVYDSTMVGNQIQGLYDAGLTGGYMTWNSGSSIDKYTSLKPAFRKDYLS